MSDYTAIGVQSAQLLLAESAKRIADYVRDNPVPPKDFNRSAKAVAAVASNRTSQTLGKYNGLDTDSNAPNGQGASAGQGKVLAFPSPTPPAVDIADAGSVAQTVVLPPELAQTVETANNVIQFFQGKIDALRKQNELSKNSAPASVPFLPRESGLLADKRA